MIAPLPNSPADQLASLNGLDWLLILVLAWSVVLAFLRGIVRELFGLAGTILGLLLAAWNYLTFAEWLRRWISSPFAADATAFLTIALGVVIVCTLLGRLLSGTVHTIGLGFLDRVAGAGFGLLRGGLIATGILMAATAFFPPQPLIAHSRLAPYFLAAAREVSFLVPQDLQQRISGGIDSIRHIARR